ncbi:rod shape-determining protein MreD [Patescibacteria group bacterium]|nr:rod shape-determining protein MreD [Patescibacteria group bacterium]
MFKWLINLLIILVLVLLQTSIFSVLPYFKNINFVLLFIIFLTLQNDKSFLPLAIIAGYLLDIYSSYTFGIHILAITGVSFLSNYIYFNILTNHRFFPVIFLMSFIIVVYHFIISTTVFGLGFLKLLPKTETADSSIIKNTGIEIIYTLVLVSIIYLLFYMAKKNLKSAFLSRGSARKSA